MSSEPAIKFMEMAERAFAERDRLRARLVQIASVCADNASVPDRGKAMALDFVRQVADSALSAGQRQEGGG